MRHLRSAVYCTSGFMGDVVFAVMARKATREKEVYSKRLNKGQHRSLIYVYDCRVIL